jgi:hypothetical protein
MQRAERIVLVAGGTMVAAWYAADPDSAAAVVPILGTTMLLCGAFSAATAVHRWIVAYRELVRQSAEAVVVVDEPIVQPVAARSAMALPAAAVHKVRPLEQH